MAGAGLIYFLGLLFITGCLFVIFYRIVCFLFPGLSLLISTVSAVLLSIVTFYFLRGVDWVENNLGLTLLIALILAGVSQALTSKSNRSFGQILGNGVAVISIIAIIIITIILVLGISIGEID